MGRDRSKCPERPAVRQHVGMEFHFDSAGWILCAEARIKKAEEERTAAEQERESAEEIRQEAEKQRETAEEKREETAREAIKSIGEALKSIDDIRRPCLIDLSEAYQDAALEVAAEFAEGHPVPVYIREKAGGPLAAVIRVRSTDDAWILTSGQSDGAAEGGIAQLSQKQYAIDRQTGDIQIISGEILPPLLTADAVQDTLEDLDEKTAALPVSQRQAAELRKKIENLNLNGIPQVHFGPRAEFPEVGVPRMLYIDTSNERTYRWDEASAAYRCVGWGINDGDEVVLTAQEEGETPTPEIDMYILDGNASEETASAVVDGNTNE